MDDKWRTLTCPMCRGYGLLSAPMAWYGFTECDYCGESGTIWLRPKGHSFEYPGGPATGMWEPEYYERGTPQMPYQWHAWLDTEEEIEKFVLDRNAGFDENLNTVHCACGFVGTIKEHKIHSEEERVKFVEERR